MHVIESVPNMALNQVLFEYYGGIFSNLALLQFTSK